MRGVREGARVNVGQSQGCLGKKTGLTCRAVNRSVLSHQPCIQETTASYEVSRPVSQPQVTPLMTLEEGEAMLLRMPPMSSAEALAMIQRNLGHKMTVVSEQR